jgi:hypothetical protein
MDGYIVKPKHLVFTPRYCYSISNIKLCVLAVVPKVRAQNINLFSHYLPRYEDSTYIVQY